MTRNLGSMHAPIPLNIVCAVIDYLLLSNVKTLVYWYSHQEMFIRWGNSCSNKFYVTNGVKQGGILSPALFNVYMNNLSVTLNQSGIGGFIGDSLVNHICYADDLCLIALS